MIGYMAITIRNIEIYISARFPYQTILFFWNWTMVLFKNVFNFFLKILCSFLNLKNVLIRFWNNKIGKTGQKINIKTALGVRHLVTICFREKKTAERTRRFVSPRAAFRVSRTHRRCRVRRRQCPRPPPTSQSLDHLREKALSFALFPHVCPEPVLLNGRCVSKDKKGNTVNRTLAHDVALASLFWMVVQRGRIDPLVPQLAANSEHLVVPARGQPVSFSKLSFLASLSWACLGKWLCPEPVLAKDRVS